MTSIDLIVLGILADQPLSAYDIQKLVEYRQISKWVKVSTPSIYKKVLQLEGKGLISGNAKKEGKMPEKVIYSLTAAGRSEFESLMLEISSKPTFIYLDLNAVIVNLDKLNPKKREQCLNNIKGEIAELKAHLEIDIQKKDNLSNIPVAGIAVLHQQYILAQAIEAWLDTLQ